MVKADKVIEFVKFALEGTCVEHGNTKIAFLRDGTGVGGFDDSRKFFDVISCFLCHPIGPDFRESMHYETVIAWDPGLGVIGRSLMDSLSMAFRGNL